MPTCVLYQGSGEWSALYVDGELVEVGDHYLSENKIYNIFGIEVICSDSFMMGGNDYADVASNLEEIHTYDVCMNEKKKTAEDLRAQASLLLKEANLIEGKTK